MTQLYLHNNQLTRWSSLTNLCDAPGNQLSGTIPASLGNLTSLTHLYP